ncbi:hypothetical protein PFISCL1PPCAC_1260, partial [Pristionchus fissidentatus]
MPQFNDVLEDGGHCAEDVHQVMRSRQLHERGPDAKSARQLLQQHSYADLLLLRGQMQFDLDFVRLYGNTHGDCCFLPQPELIEYPLSYCKWRPAHKHTRTHTSADFSNPPSIKNLRILVFYTEHRSKQTLTILNYSAITTSFRLYPLRFKIPRKYGEPCDPHPSFNYATVYIIYATILYSSNLPIK